MPGNSMLHNVKRLLVLLRITSDLPSEETALAPQVDFGLARKMMPSRLVKANRQGV